MDHAVQLWGTGTSRTFRPIWVAEELGVRYELTPMGPRTGETQTPEYTRLNPKQKIPFFMDGELKLAESVAICQYLIDVYPNPAVFRPDTAEERARVDDWCCYIYGELDETSLYVMRRHGDLGPIYGASPEVVASAGEYAMRHLNVIEGQLGGRQYLMEQGFSLADMLLMTCLDWAVAYGLTLPEGLARYRGRIAERDAYQRAFSVNFQQAPAQQSKQQT